MWALLVILILVLCVGAVLGWVSLFQLQTQRREIEQLRLRMRYLERAGDPLDGDGVRPAQAQLEKRPDPVRRAEAPRSPAPAPARAAIVQPKARTTTEMAGPTRAKPRPSRPAIDLETLLGAKGSVWIGGLALLLGAVFLLRYTIEAGLLTPVMRVALAVLLGIVSLGASEVLARRDLKTPVGQALAARADIPALLAAVGVFALFGAAYAAHALYGLLGTTPAFAAMAAVAFATMALSLRRGPWLAAVGLIGALAVPLLVASVTPSFLGVLAYAALITGAALWVARRRAWDWLVLAAAVGATVWLSMLVGKAASWPQFLAWTAGLAALLALIVPKLGPLVTVKDWRDMLPNSGWLGIAVLAGLASAAGDDMGAASALVPVLVCGGLIAFAQTGREPWRWPALLVGAGVFALHFVTFIMPEIPNWLWQAVCALVVAGTMVSALRIGSQFETRQSSYALIVVCGVLAILMTEVSTDRLFTQDLARALGFFILAGFIGLCAVRQSAKPVVEASLAVAGLAWGLGATVLDDLQSASLVLSLGIAVFAMAAFRRDSVPARLVAVAVAGMAGLVAAIAVDEPAQAIGQAPFLNSLWIFYGLPGALLALCTLVFARRRVDLGSQSMAGGAFVFLALLVVFLVHHAMNGGDLSAEPGFEDIAVQLLIALTAMLGASWMGRGDGTAFTDWPGRDASPGRYIMPSLTIGAAALSLIVFSGSQLLHLNPLLTNETLIDGHSVFNALALGFLLPSLLLGASALRYAGRRPDWFVRTLAALSGAAWLVWTTAQIRRLAHGPDISLKTVPWESAELYAVSAVWLLTGLAVLAAGWKTGRRDIRLASAILITLTTLKVFLLDMSELDGALRALSFIGLGIALIGIGRLYQRLLSDDSDKPENRSATVSGGLTG